MAEKQWPGRSHAPETENEDPFAELTRIMGFDPREPVAPRQQASVLSSNEDDDLGIDLEKELMADLDSFGDAPHSHAENLDQGSAQQAQAPSYLEDDFYGTPASAPASSPNWDANVFSNAFDDAFQPRVAEPAQTANDQIDDFNFDLDDALANELSMPDEPVQQHGFAPIEQDAYGVTPEAAAERVEQNYDATAWQQPHVAHWSGDVSAEPEVRPIADDLTEIDFGDFEFEEAETVAETINPSQDYSVEQGWVSEQVYHSPEPVAAAPQSFEDELSAFLSGDVDPFHAPEQAEPGAAFSPASEPHQVVQDGENDFWREFQTGVTVPEQGLTQEEPVADAFDGFELDFDEPSETLDARPLTPVETAERDYAFDDSPFARDYGDDDLQPASLDEWQPAQQPDEVEEQVDPFAALESLSLDSLADEQDEEPRTEAAFAPLTASQAQELTPQSGWTHEDVAEASALSVRHAVDRSRTDVPEIETIEISDSASPLKDDLDIPEFDFEPEEAVSHVEPHDDFESELSGAFGSPARTEPARTVASASAAESVRDDFDNEWERDLNAAIAGAGMGVGAAAAADASRYAGESHSMQHQYDVDDDAPDYASHGSSYQPVRQQIASAPRKPIWKERATLLVAGVAGLVILIGGAVAWGTWNGSDGGGDGEPVLISADDRPVRMRPESADGAEETADNNVFQTMAGNQNGGPQQETLAGGAEQPVDVSAMRQTENSLPGVETPALAPGMESDKIEDRVAATPEAEQGASDVATVAPRRVRTLVVRPDGTLAPREDPTPAPIQSQAEADTSDAQQQLVANVPATAAIPTQSVLTTSITPQSQNVPATATPPVAPTVPEQQQAAAPTAAAQVAPAEGEWSIQIASQPSREAAQSSYNSLSQRYGSVLGGRNYNIVAAQIEGRGTFYRVRVNGGTRDQAIQLCEQYKGAGGSCFVSR